MLSNLKCGMVPPRNYSLDTRSCFMDKSQEASSLRGHFMRLKGTKVSPGRAGCKMVVWKCGKGSSPSPAQPSHSSLTPNRNNFFKAATIMLGMISSTECEWIWLWVLMGGVVCGGQQLETTSLQSVLSDSPGALCMILHGGLLFMR